MDTAFQTPSSSAEAVFWGAWANASVRITRRDMVE